MSDTGQDLAAGLAIALAVEAKRQKLEALMPSGSGQSVLPLFGDVPELAVIDGDVEDLQRGQGRPPGSKNKRAQEFANYILSQVGSPLMVLGKTYSRPVAALAEELECSLADAFKLQLDAAKALAPYVHQKLPQALEIEEVKALPGLAIGVSKEYSENPNHQTVEIPLLKVIEPD